MSPPAFFVFLSKFSLLLPGTGSVCVRSGADLPSGVFLKILLRRTGSGIAARSCLYVF